MHMSGNTILITGGASGIGRGLAESFHRLVNQVIIAGRRKQALDETTAANAGMKSIVLNIADPASITSVGGQLEKDFPSLNVVIHNAGIMKPENLSPDKIASADAEAMVATNLLGPIRLTAALLPQLARQPRAAVMTVSSGLAFLPLAITPTYCATKAAIHSWTQSLRFQLRNTHVEVIEIIPPYVQTHLMGSGQANDPRAMPLDEFIAETMQILTKDPKPMEVCVERVKPLRFAAESGKFVAAFQHLNESMTAE